MHSVGTYRFLEFSRSKTPCYVYDLDRITFNVERLRLRFGDDLTLLYAVMANSNIDILKHLSGLSIGFFVNSLNHLNLIKSISDNITIYCSTGTKHSDMRQISESSSYFFADSPLQFSLFHPLAGDCRLGVRLNVFDVISSKHTIPTSSMRIGITQKEFIEISRSFRNELKAVHVYTGTDNLSPKLFMDSLNSIFALCETEKTSVEVIDIGGGLPNSDKVSDETLDEVALSWNTHKLRRRRSIFIELGRFIVENSSVFCATIIDIKYIYGNIYAITDTSATSFPRRLLYGVNPKFDIYRDGDRVVTLSDHSELFICGGTTLSSDVISRSPAYDIRIGDTVIFKDAGAYSESCQIHHLGAPKPLSILVQK